jgi:arabinogalactan endo-1,4-beta-galactosidase
MKDRWGKGSSWENNAFFDFDGNLLPGLNFMKRK